MDTREWVILDTETDGLCVPIHVVEVAAQRMIGTEPVGEPFQIYINHNVPIPSAAFAVHGYSQEFLRQNGIRPADAYERLKEYVDERLVSAHYLRFDWDQTLTQEWHRLGIPTIGQKGMCTWFLSRRVIHETPSHKLDCLRDHFTLKCNRPHSALGDVEAVVDLFRRVLLPRLSRVGISTYDEIYDFSRSLPIARCLCLIQERNFEEEQRRTKETKKLLQRLENGSVDDIGSLILERKIIVQPPDIHFRDRVFLFTGKMTWGPRSKAEQLVLELGGQLAKSKSMTNELDYLVLGEDR